MKVRVISFIYYPQNVPGKEKSLNKFSLCPLYHLQIVLVTKNKDLKYEQVKQDPCLSHVNEV